MAKGCTCGAAMHRRDSTHQEHQSHCPLISNNVLANTNGNGGVTSQNERSSCTHLRIAQSSDRDPHHQKPSGPYNSIANYVIEEDTKIKTKKHEGSLSEGYKSLKPLSNVGTASNGNNLNNNSTSGGGNGVNNTNNVAIVIGNVRTQRICLTNSSPSEQHAYKKRKQLTNNNNSNSYGAQ